MKVYLCCHYRGEKGDDASQGDIQANIQKAQAMALDIQKHWPNTVSLYVPHLDPDLQEYNDGWMRGEVTTKEILDICKEKLSTCDGILVVLQGYFSEGMKEEFQYAIFHGLEYLVVDEWDDYARDSFAYQVHGWIERG